MARLVAYGVGHKPDLIRSMNRLVASRYRQPRHKTYALVSGSSAAYSQNAGSHRIGFGSASAGLAGLAGVCCG